jgi:hypothetical protein
MIANPPEERLERVLDSFSSELVAATDEEVLAAAAELEMQSITEDLATFLGPRDLTRALRDRTPK